MLTLTPLLNLIRSEPVATMTVVEAVLGVGLAFGLGWTLPQVAAVEACAAAVLTLLTRQSVTPNIHLEQPK